MQFSALGNNNEGNNNEQEPDRIQHHWKHHRWIVRLPLWQPEKPGKYFEKDSENLSEALSEISNKRK